MQLKMKINDIEYTVTIQPYLLPYIKALAISFTSMPTTIEIARQTEKTIKEAWDEVKKHIFPTPPDDYEVFAEIVMQLVRKTSEAIEQAVRRANFTFERPGIQ